MIHFFHQLGVICLMISLSCCFGSFPSRKLSNLAREKTWSSRKAITSDEQEYSETATGSYEFFFPTPKRVVPLNNIGYQHALNLSYGEDGDRFIDNIILDTGSSHLVLKQCVNTRRAQSHCYACVNVNGTEVECLESNVDDMLCPTLSIDQGFAKTQGCQTLSDQISLKDEEAAEIPFVMVRWLNVTIPKLHQWGTAGGILGAAYASSLTFPKLMTDNKSPFMVFLQQANPQRALFGVDANGVDSPSQLHLGGFAEAYQSNLQWSDFQVTEELVYHKFHIYGLEMCGFPLFAGYSGHWPALLDTGAVCLTLPQEFFELLMTWVDDVDCQLDGPQGHQWKACYISADSNSALPYLSFRMSEIGETLYLPLSSLLLEDGSELCIREGASILQDNLNYGEVFNIDMPEVVFGSLVLRAMYLAVDMDAGRIAFANKLVVDSTSPAGLPLYDGCAAPVECPRSWSFEYLTNTCTPPICTQYFFWRYNHQSQECELKADFYGVLIFLLVSCALAEVVIHCLNRYYTVRSGVGQQGVNVHHQTQSYDYRAGIFLDKTMDRVIQLYRGSQPSTTNHAVQQRPDVN
mmetsp:Transcript_19893/g.25677  ORF Transcript_19893/g.25677 Transcript_19893/m.25677 type:complete len:577 (+) Transcript_19893:43-1773(+)